jgi:DNA-binding response OmpR family regulator
MRSSTFPLLLLTNDLQLEMLVRESVAEMGCDVIVGHSPCDAARLLARHLDLVGGVLVDLDSCDHGSVWLGTLSSLPRKIPAIAISRLDPRFLRVLAQQNGADYWLCKPANALSLEAAIGQLRAARALPRGLGGNILSGAEHNT